MLGTGHGQGQSDWKRYRIEEGLAAAFPKPPSRETLTKNGLEVRRYTALFGMGVYRIASYSDSAEVSRQISEELQSDPGGPAVRAVMKSTIDGCNAELKGRVSDVQFGGFKGYPMERCRIETNHLVVYVATVCAEKKIVCLLAAQPKGAEDLGRIQKFFDSLEL